MTRRKGSLPAPEPQRVELRVARLLKAHGLKGGIKLELYTDDPELRFQPGARLSVQVPTDSPWFGQQLTVRELKFFSSQPVAFFEGVDDRTQAETLIKAILWVEADPEADTGEDDSWFDHQLVGLEVRREGQRVGEVVRVDHLPAQDLLVIRPDGRADDVLLPFVKAFVPEVSIEQNYLTVTPPGGLFDTADDATDGDG